MNNDVAFGDQAVSAMAAARRRDWTAWGTIALFCFCIAVPALVQALGWGGGSSENRTLAPPPSWPGRVSDLPNLPQQVQAFLADRFGLRSQLVRANSLARYAIGVSTSPNVVIGRDGYLFYAYPHERLMEQHTGEDVFSPEKLDEWVASIAESQAWLAQRGISLYVLIAPDKSTIYPEHLPEYPRLPGATTRLDQIVGALAGRRDIALIDPRAALMAQKAEHPIYPRADSHWSPRGAFVAYSLLVDRIRERFPSVQPVSLADYQLGLWPTWGDLAGTLNLGDVLMPKEEYAKRRAATHVVEVENRPRDPDWGWPVTVAHTDLQGRPKILVQGDSFVDYTMRSLYLNETFKEVTFTHHNGTALNKRLIEELRPDIVVMEFAQRYLAP